MGAVCHVCVRRIARQAAPDPYAAVADSEVEPAAVGIPLHGEGSEERAMGMKGEVVHEFGNHFADCTNVHRDDRVAPWTQYTYYCLGDLLGDARPALDVYDVVERRGRRHPVQ